MGEYGAKSGVRAHVETYQERTLEVTCSLRAATPAAFYARQDIVLGALDALNGEVLLNLGTMRAQSAALQRGYLAILTGLTTTQTSEQSAEYEMEWLVPSGTACALSSTTQTGVTIAATMYEPATAGQTVAGNLRADVVWTFTAGGSVTAITFANSTTGQTLEWTGSLSAGEKLKLDGVKYHIEKYTGGAWENAMAGLDDADPFPQLQGGVRNTLTVSGIAGTLDYTYRPQFRW
jgi:hypothetical protein